MKNMVPFIWDVIRAEASWHVSGIDLQFVSWYKRLVKNADQGMLDGRTVVEEESGSDKKKISAYVVEAMRLTCIREGYSCA